MRSIQNLLAGKKLLKIIIDIIAIILGFLIALSVRFEFSVPRDKFARFILILPGVVIVFILFNWMFKIYSGRWKYASFDEVLNLTSADVLATSFVFIFIIAIPGARAHLSISETVMGGVLALFIMGFIRLQYRLFGEMRLRRGGRGGARVLIIGAGESGEMVARDMFRHPGYNLIPVGFIDDDKSKQNLYVQGVPVIGGREDIPEAVLKLDIDQIFITIPSLQGKQIRDIVTICETTDADIKILPPLLKSMSKRIGAYSVRELRVEDLLGREPFKLDVHSVSATITSNSILVTGGSGSIGSILAQHIASLGPKCLLVLDNNESGLFEVENELRRRFPECNCRVVMADIRDEERIIKIFDKYRPDFVFHTAASKHVPMMEMHPTEAVKNNVLGTKILAETALRYGAKGFILYSSIKAEKPDNIMGVTKHIAEKLLYFMNSTSESNFASFRLGNVLGTRGSVIFVFQKLIEQGGPINVTHPDASRYFLTIDEAALMTIQAGSFMEGGEIFMPDMGEPVKIMDLAENMMGLMRPEADIKINITGLRPGEKAQEDLLLPADVIKSTPHDKIYKLDYHFKGKETFLKDVNTLIDAAKRNDEREVKIMLAKLVPTYTPKGLEEEEIAEEKGKPELRVVKEE